MGFRQQLTTPRRQDGQNRHFLFVLNLSLFGVPTQEIYFFNINPDEYRKSEPNLVEVTQTIGGAFVDDFGVGIPTITMRGHTGWHSSLDPSDRTVRDGVSFYLKLLELFRKTTGDGLRKKFEDARIDREDTELWFINPQDEEGWVVVPEAFDTTRNKTRPLLYQYDIRLKCLRLLGSERRSFIDPLGVAIGLLNPEIRAERAYDELLTLLDDFETITIGPRQFTQEEHIEDEVKKDYSNEIVVQYRNSLALIRRLIRDVGRFVSKETSFIPVPLTIYDETLQTLTAIIDLIDVLSDIDLTARRTYKHFYYNILSLDRSLFVGVVNPNSITGTSTGSETFGQPPSVLADSDNSLLDVSGAVIKPTHHELFEPISDPENSPTEVQVSVEVSEIIGVFLVSDIEEEVDLSDGFNGRTILLKRNPTENYLVHYKGVVERIDLRQRVNSLKRVNVSEGDTLQSLALTHLGDALRWREIATINGLEFPYLVPDDFVTEFKATGEITFTRSEGYFPQIDISIGTEITTLGPAEDNLTYFKNIQFVTTAASSILIGANSVTVPIEAFEVGEIGNVNADQIVLLTIPITGITSVNNENPVEGGRVIQVRRLGEGLVIPVPQTANPVIVNATDEEQLYGTDINLELQDEFEGEILPGSDGDMRRITGLDNFIQAIKMRFLTLRGELSLHPRYGTILPLLIGMPSTGAMNVLVNLEIREVLLSEPRIASIQSLNVALDGDIFRIDADVRLIEGNQTVPLNLIAKA